MLAELLGDDPTVHHRLLRRFVGEAKKSIQEIHQTRSAADIHEQAHKLKGSARSQGAKALANLCQSLETAGKSEDWIRVYIEGQYGYDTDNKPVYPEYKDSVHCSEGPLEPIKGLPVFIGTDFGLTPASVMAQRTATGQWRFIAELVSEDMGAVRHAENLSAMLDEWFPEFEFKGWGDPAGGQRRTDIRCREKGRDPGLGVERR